MDIERLTKAQIVLLTLLVSFVTSIATGIVTVTLVDQAPPVVTQTISRVVERTVESVPSDEENSSGSGASQEVVTREVTVVVKESDLIADAVTKVDKSVVRIYEPAEIVGEVTDPRGTFLGIGLVISRDGFVVTDSSLIAPGETYIVATADGVTYEARLKNESTNRPTAIIELDTKGDPTAIFPPVAFTDLSTLKLGQGTFTLSGAARTTVTTGVISDLILSEDETPTTAMISVDSGRDGIILGAPLVDLLGEIVGIYTTESKAITTGVNYTSNTTVKEQLAEVHATEGQGI